MQKQRPTTAATLTSLPAAESALLLPRGRRAMLRLVWATSGDPVCTLDADELQWLEEHHNSVRAPRICNGGWAAASVDSGERKKGRLGFNCSLGGHYGRGELSELRRELSGVVESMFGFAKTMYQLVRYQLVQPPRS